MSIPQIKAASDVLTGSLYNTSPIPPRSGISPVKIEFLEGRAEKIRSYEAIRLPNGTVTRKEVYFLPRLNKQVVVFVGECWTTPARDVIPVVPAPATRAPTPATRAPAPVTRAPVPDTEAPAPGTITTSLHRVNQTPSVVKGSLAKS